MKHVKPLILAAVLAAVPVGTRAQEQQPDLPLNPQTAPLAAPNAADAGKVARLIDQLGSSEFPKREAAMKELRAIGKPAIPALKEALNSDDAEVVSRAKTLIRRIEVRPVPRAMAPDGAVQATGVRMSVVNGSRVLTVNENGRTTRITEGEDGISMSVTGELDGERVTERFTAPTLDALKQENPEAYAHYEQITGGVGAAGGGFIQRGGVIRLGGGALQLGGGVQVMPFQPAPDELDLLRVRLEKQMRENKLADEKHDEVIRELEKVADARVAAGLDMEKYTEQCDAFRKVLETHKLDPGELLPPPAKTRLGVSIATNGVSLTVQRLAENSRAERIGLQAGDEIRKVNGKDVGTVAELRVRVGEKEKGMTLDITRDGRDMRLEEKEEKK